jgi:hypothetical protein
MPLPNAIQIPKLSAHRKNMDFIILLAFYVLIKCHPNAKSSATHKKPTLNSSSS